MIVSVYGAGYVGLVSAVCFASKGYFVTCADVDEKKIVLLQQGICPFYEKDLPRLLIKAIQQKRIQFTTQLAAAARHAPIHIIATGTPSLEDGSADLSQVWSVVTTIAQHITSDGTLVVKSTVPVGTGDTLAAYLYKKRANGKKNSYRLNIVSNPEFLREGNAVVDFLKAERIVVGGNNAGFRCLKKLYQPWTEKGIPLLTMSRTSAELTKYAANTMLASKISFINQISQIAEKVGADIDDIQRGIGSDSRIGPYFLNAGIGYGGSCFPKDGRALLHTAQQVGVDAPLLVAMETINRRQKEWVIVQLLSHFPEGLQSKTIGIWGLSFKPGTEDIREASSLEMIRSLLEKNAYLRLYDPAAMPKAQGIFQKSEQIVWCDTAEHVFDSPLDALIIATEWPVFKRYPLTHLQTQLGHAPLIDGRNCFCLNKVKKAGFRYYYSVGRPFIKNTHSK